MEELMIYLDAFGKLTGEAKEAFIIWVVFKWGLTHIITLIWISLLAYIIHKGFKTFSTMCMINKFNQKAHGSYEVSIGHRESLEKIFDYGLEVMREKYPHRVRRAPF